MSLLRRMSALCLVATLLLAGCGLNPATPIPTKADPGVVLTAAAETALAGLNAMPSPTPPGQPTAVTTPAPSAIPTLNVPTLPPMIQESITPTATIASTTAANPPPASTGDRAEFAADVTVPDGTVFNPGVTFVKTWRLKNTGTTTWTTGYTIIRVSNDAIKGPPSVNIPKNVAPGETVDISVSLTTPQDTGIHTSYWKLKNEQGGIFGIGAQANTPFYVQVDVAGSGTPVPTSASGTPSGSILSKVSLNVDNASYSGSCPHTFTFTVNFTLSKATDVTYKLQAGSDTPGYTFQLPAAQTQNFPAGSRSLSYTLDLTDSGSGWAKMIFTAPEALESNQVTFALECK